MVVENKALKLIAKLRKKIWNKIIPLRLLKINDKFSMNQWNEFDVH